MLQAEITYATTEQHAKQHWSSSVHGCTVHLQRNTTRCWSASALQCAAHHGRYGVFALLCLMLQAEITYATTAQHAKQHWPSSEHGCTVHLQGNTTRCWSASALQCAADHGRYGAFALLCLMLKAEITYATTAQHAKQHWPSSVRGCTLHMKGNTT